MSTTLQARQGKRLRSLVERIERLNEEIGSLGMDRKDLFSEASAAGYEPKIVREIIKRRKMDPQELETADELRDLYEREMKLGHNSDGAEDDL